MLRVTILGCGTSSGVPRVGNDWGACDPAEPRNRRTRASVLVESARTRILVDTGPDLREQLLAADVSHLDAVLWTHDHADHCHGLDDLRPVSQAMRGPVRGFAHRKTAGALYDRFAYAFEGNANYPAIIAMTVLPDEALVIGDITVSHVAQPHGGIFSSGFRFDHAGVSVGYATDFHEVTPSMRDFYAGVDLWVVDALRERPHPTHPHLELTLAAIADAAPTRAVLTHMDTSMDYRRLCDALPPHVSPGYDGMTLSVSQRDR